MITRLSLHYDLIMACISSRDIPILCMNDVKFHLQNVLFQVEVCSLLFKSGSLPFRHRRVSHVSRDLRALGDEVIASIVQSLIGVGADHIWCATVRVVSSMAFLSIRDRQIL